MAEKCEYFFEETKKISSKTLRSKRSPLKPTVHTYKYCDHINSKHKKGTINQAICEGDLEKCDIPENER